MSRCLPIQFLAIDQQKYGHLDQGLWFACQRLAAPAIHKNQAKCGRTKTATNFGRPNRLAGHTNPNTPIDISKLVARVPIGTIHVCDLTNKITSKTNQHSSIFKDTPLCYILYLLMFCYMSVACSHPPTPAQYMLQYAFNMVHALHRLSRRRPHICGAVVLSFNNYTLNSATSYITNQHGQCMQKREHSKLLMLVQNQYYNYNSSTKESCSWM